MQRVLLISVFFLSVSTYNQSYTQLLKRAVMVVHSDYSSFSLDSNGSVVISEIMSYYEFRELKSKGFLQTKFFIVKPKCIDCEECFYILSYSTINKRFFKLKGFKVNEFTEFFYTVLMQEFPSVSSKSPKRALKSLLEIPLEIENIDLKTAYDKYHKDYKKSLFDDSSCYRKMQIQ